MKIKQIITCMVAISCLTACSSATESPVPEYTAPKVVLPTSEFEGIRYAEIVDSLSSDEIPIDITDPDPDHAKIIACVRTIAELRKEPLIMSEIMDSNVIAADFGLDISDGNVQNYVVYQEDGGDFPSEIIIVKAIDIDSVKTIFQDHKTLLSKKNNNEHAEMINSSIVGDINDYAYFIMTNDASTDEAVILRMLTD